MKLYSIKLTCPAACGGGAIQLFKLIHYIMLFVGKNQVFLLISLAKVAGICNYSLEKVDD